MSVSSSPGITVVVAVGAVGVGSLGKSSEMVMTTGSSGAYPVGVGYVTLSLMFSPGRIQGRMENVSSSSEGTVEEEVGDDVGGGSETDIGIVE